MIKLTRQQRKTYERLRYMDYRYYEELPHMGLICMRKERSSGFEHITIKKDGSTVSGNLCEEKTG